MQPSAFIQLYNRNNVKTFFVFAAPWWPCDGNKQGFIVLWGGLFVSFHRADKYLQEWKLCLKITGSNANLTWKLQSCYRCHNQQQHIHEPGFILFF